MNPLVSVVVTTYNQASYIIQTIESALAQTYEPYEVIVVDDGSTDETQACIAFFGDRIISVRQNNSGVAGSRNTGISKARGDYIAFLDGDDLWDPEKLSSQVEAAIANPASGLIVVDGQEFDESGIISSSLFFEPWCKDISEDSVASGCFYHQLLNKQFITTTSQVMIPAKVFEAVGLSDMRFKGASDYDLYIRIAAKYDVTIIKKRLTWWRYISTSVSGARSLRSFRYLPEDIAILKKHMRVCQENDISLIRQNLKTRLYEEAEKLYYYGLEADRAFATRTLLKLQAGNISYPVFIVFLAGLWCPGSLRNTLGRVVRLVFLKFN